MGELHDDPAEWAKLAAKLSADRAAEEAITIDDGPEVGDDDWLRTWDDEEPTGVFGGFDGERPEGASCGEAIDPMPGTAVAHLMDEISEQAHAIGPAQLHFSIGRGRKNDLQISVDGEVSRNHAQITRNGDSFYVEDLGSTNGTLVNGRLVESARLFGGEEVQIGLTRLRFVLM
ncbi:MAG TPA: FHA domain-containing protein [Myxococcota bacterium]|nr:FHA domain-containing protein [Myxococcota bacterium]